MLGLSRAACNKVVQNGSKSSDPPWDLICWSVGIACEFQFLSLMPRTKVQLVKRS